jgi:hypothetical protein
METRINQSRIMIDVAPSEIFQTAREVVMVPAISQNKDASKSFRDDYEIVMTAISQNKYTPPPALNRVLEQIRDDYEIILTAISQTKYIPSPALQRASALEQIQADRELVLTFPESRGGMPLAGLVRQYDPIYASDTLRADPEIVLTFPESRGSMPLAGLVRQYDPRYGL